MLITLTNWSTRDLCRFIKTIIVIWFVLFRGRISRSEKSGRQKGTDRRKYQKERREDLEKLRRQKGREIRIKKGIAEEIGEEITKTKSTKRKRRKQKYKIIARRPEKTAATLFTTKTTRQRWGTSDTPGINFKRLGEQRTGSTNLKNSQQKLQRPF